MSPRPYRADRRKSAAAETRRRIVEAVVDLHAERGVMATSYAMIAERADVAIPTVYNHFPKPGDLMAACFAHSMAQAPPIGPQIFDDAPDLEARLHALVRALFAFYRFRAPLLRWTFYEARLVSDMAALQKKASEGRRQLIALALAPAFGPRPPEALAALCEILLDFPAWQRFASERGPSGEDAETVLAEALIALARQHGAAARQARGAGRPKPRTGGRPA